MSVVQKNYDELLEDYKKLQKENAGFKNFYAKDNTNRALAEQVLQKTDFNYRTVVENANEAIIIAQSHYLRFANLYTVQLLEYSMDEILNTRFTDFIHPDDRDIVMDFFFKRINGEKIPNRYFFRVLTKNNNIKWVEVNAVLIDWDGKPASLGFLIDVTERKLAEDALGDSEEKYFLVMDNASEAIFVVQDGLLVSINHNAKNYLEYDTEEVLNKPFRDFIHKDDLQLVVENHKRRIRGDKLASKYPFRIVTRSGKTKWVELNSVLIKWRDQPATLNFLTDITERILLESELVKSKKDAEESNRLKSAFLANMSHEIRTPVHGIIGFSQFLKEPDLWEAEKHDFLQILNSSCQRLLKTIDDVLDISKIDSGQIEINETGFLIENLFNELYDFHLSKFSGSKIEFKYSIQNELKSILFLSDEQKVYQILNNLLNNAYKFTQQGSVEFGCRIKSNKVEFFVKDTGIGIAKSAQGYIFGRFNQETFSLSRDYEGAGLGLAISKGLVEIMGGKISVQSEKGGGSTFIFTLPLKTEILRDKSNVSIIETKEIKDFSDVTVLIAEDDLYNYLMLEHIVTKELGAQVIHAEDGKTALDIFTNHPNISLVLMDIKMPIMDGHTTTRKIKKLNPHIPIIAVTAFGLKGDSEKAIAAGCDDYISKPIKNEELIKKMKIWLSYFPN
jgi:PAS domain S-box-containing protein